MAIFRYVRQDCYDDLDLEVALTLNRSRGANRTAHACLKATGRPGSRERWRRDFWEWAKDRELDAYAPRYGNRRSQNSSTYDCHLRTWQVVADFLLQWVGTEALSFALEVGMADSRAHADLTTIGESLVALRREVAELRFAAQRQQLAFQKAGLALIGSGALLASSDT